ncbi:zona pellucida sperm-binding protein 3-like [Cetorhinus maximus]
MELLFPLSRYFRKGNVSSDPIKPTWIPFSSTKSGEGNLSFSLRLMKGDWLTERTSTVYYLGELIHIEASVSMTNHMPLKLYIDRCVATLSPDKDSTPRYSFIDHNGCLLDSKAEDSFSTFVLPRDEQELDKLRFDLDAFRFLGDDRSLPPASPSVLLRVAEHGLKTRQPALSIRRFLLDAASLKQRLQQPQNPTGGIVQSRAPP